ncbi:MAG: DUF1569 domain-containing protein [Ignavibacteria bacterium]|nr:DUF1569 domain-containing protein [Ignavibacteria bacterium]
MPLPDIWNPEATARLCSRISSIAKDTKPAWGQMNAAQMMGHCCIPYEQALGIKTTKPPAYMRIALKLFFKKTLTNDAPYKKNMPTAPAFIMPADIAFEENKQRLLKLVHDISDMGRDAFEGREQLTLGRLSAQEWNNLLYKHIDHHLRQFGV